MDSYIDIKLLPDPEFHTSMLMSALYNKLHRALVQLQDNRLGVSFPDYQSVGKRSVGETLRLHGSQQSLAKLMDSNWLKGMNDHIEKTDVQAVPQTTKALKVSRVQCKSNVDRLRERHMKRHGVSYEQALAAIPQEAQQRLELPFIAIKSASTSQQFRLYIDQREMATANLDATFNCYGLSATGTVPSF